MDPFCCLFGCESCNTLQAVEALDKSLDMEIVAREQRQTHIEEEQWSSW